MYADVDLGGLVLAGSGKVDAPEIGRLQHLAQHPQAAAAALQPVVVQRQLRGILLILHDVVEVVDHVVAFLPQVGGQRGVLVPGVVDLPLHGSNMAADQVQYRSQMLFFLLPLQLVHLPIPYTRIIECAPIIAASPRKGQSCFTVTLGL